MKTNIAILSALFISVCSPALAEDHDHEHPLTAQDLVEVTQVAVQTFARTASQADLDAVFGIAVKKNEDGDSAQVAVHYKSGAMKKQANYFCHMHDDNLDCHKQ